MFFREIVKRTGLLPSRAEGALAELVSQGFVTADSFEGLRALLLPEKKRVSFGAADKRRHYIAVTGVEFAGPVVAAASARTRAPLPAGTRRSKFWPAVLLRRYGVVFRRMLEREAFNVPWFEFVRVYRRMEARGEIRGGHFVAGVGGKTNSRCPTRHRLACAPAAGPGPPER